jgi:hypothetical protein
MGRDSVSVPWPRCGQGLAMPIEYNWQEFDLKPRERTAMAHGEWVLDHFRAITVNIRT